MKWPESPLVPGIFQERLHRFGAWVKVRGRREYCHVTNSGRLAELLFPGNRVLLVDHGPRSGRKTRYAVRLAFFLKKWVCIEANIAPKLLAEAWSKGRLPELKDYDQLKAEVPLNRHTRFDFQARNTKTGGIAWIEVKCVTLVDEKKVGRFPDAPSERASKHLRELMALSRKKNTECFVFFILQNAWGKAVAAKGDTDPLFAQTLAQASKTRIKLCAYRAKVTAQGASLDGAIPVKT